MAAVEELAQCKAVADVLRDSESMHQLRDDLRAQITRIEQIREATKTSRAAEMKVLDDSLASARQKEVEAQQAAKDARDRIEKIRADTAAATRELEDLANRQAKAAACVQDLQGVSAHVDNRREELQAREREFMQQSADLHDLYVAATGVHWAAQGIAGVVSVPRSGDPIAFGYEGVPGSHADDLWSLVEKAATQDALNFRVQS
mmetsp:Transcript_13434/g.29833  ORF Transcript_13434/g.29833 Transcript_13434/m.29833 type:complete len:204 (+) Transcript_13434:40-651(+)